MEGNEHLTLIYQQKVDAPTSYYLMEGKPGVLPNRVCIHRYPFAEVCCGGNGKAVGQFKATFKKSETSNYKTEKATLHSNIYNIYKATACIIGTGDIKNTNDLLIFEDRSGGNWSIIAIHIFPDHKFKAPEILTTFK